ncbi:MAG: hypothetical protein L0229_12325 [Blastocatellia bacterium]|nr:hypothetical protein [Blastocatellia bacterium]
MTVSERPRAYEEIVELLAAGPSPEEIINFRPSAAMQERVRELLAKNQAGNLTAEEEAELDEYGHIEHLMRMVKARAQKHPAS